MTRTLSIDDNGDIYIGADGSLAVATGLEAVMQTCAEAARTQLGEMLFAADQGLPNFQAVWGGAPNASQFEAYLRANLLAVSDVISVESVEIDTAGGALHYTATIKTIYGTGTL
jgi:hypothetical protein